MLEVGLKPIRLLTEIEYPDGDVEDSMERPS
jgi:hypothetical protein